MPLDTSQLQDYLFCTACKQMCPSRHAEIERWFSWHSRNCKPSPSQTRQVRTLGQAETYVPWLQTHIKMSNDLLEGYQCVLSDVELFALMGQPGNRSSGSSGSQGPQGYR